MKSIGKSCIDQSIIRVRWSTRMRWNLKKTSNRLLICNFKFTKAGNNICKCMQLLLLHWGYHHGSGRGKRACGGGCTGKVLTLCNFCNLCNIPVRNTCEFVFVPLIIFIYVICLCLFRFIICIILMLPLFSYVTSTWLDWTTLGVFFFYSQRWNIAHYHSWVII